MMKRILSLLLAFLMVVNVLSTTALAVDVETDSDSDSVVNKLVKVKSDFNGTAYETPGVFGGIFCGAGSFPELLEIRAVASVDGTVYYQLYAAEGYAWPELANNVGLTDGYWLKAEFVEIQESGGPTDPTTPSTPTDPSNPCACCDSCTGAEGCECGCESCNFCENGTEQNCPTCGQKGCASDHPNWCGICRMDDCGEKHISATVTDANGNEQTVTVTGDALPEGATLEITPVADEAAVLAELGIETGFLWNISVFNSAGNIWEPPEDNSVKLTLPIANVEDGNRVLLYHFLETEVAVSKALNGTGIKGHVGEFGNDGKTFAEPAVTAYSQVTGVTDGTFLAECYTPCVKNGMVTVDVSSFSVWASNGAWQRYSAGDSDDEIRLVDSEDRQKTFYAPIGQTITFDTNAATITKDLWRVKQNGSLVDYYSWGYKSKLTTSRGATSATINLASGKVSVGDEIVVYYDGSAATDDDWVKIIVVNEVKVTYNENRSSFGGTDNQLTEWGANQEDGEPGTKYGFHVWYNSTLVKVANPPQLTTSLGYTHVSWNTKADGTGTKVEIGSSYKPTSNITLYAQWTPNKYNVSFNANGGSSTPAAQSVTYKSAYGTLPSGAGTRTGYTFAGWYTQAEGGTQVTSTTVCTNAANHTLYARWTPNIYTVTLDKNGGVGGTDGPYYYKYKTVGTHDNSDVSDKNIYYYTDANCTQPMINGSGQDRYFHVNVPTKTGYTFTGYYHKENGTQYVAANGECVNNIYENETENSTLVAGWEANTDAWYTVYYKWKDDSGNEGQVLDSEGNVVENRHVSALEYGTKHTENAPSLPGYTLIGPSAKTMTAGYEGQADTEYTFYYTRNTYDVVFDYNGGHQDLDGSHGENGLTQKTEAMTYGSDRNTTVEWLYPHREGYVFTGWYTQPTGGTQVFGADHRHINDGTYWLNDLWHYADDGLTLYAQWRIKSYTVKFHGNGSTQGSMAEQSFHYGEAKPLTAVSFTRSYAVSYVRYDSSDNVTAESEFLGWATGANGSVVYRDGQTVSNLTTEDGVTIDLYALWEPEEITLPQSSVRPGYDFAGWDKDGTTYQPGDTYTPQSNVTFTEIWTPINYTVTFVYNDGTGKTEDRTIAYDSAYGTLPQAVRDGYLFKGWFTEVNGGTQVTASATYTTVGNTTLYARWDAVSYDVIFHGNGATSGMMPDQNFLYDISRPLDANGYARVHTVSFNSNGGANAPAAVTKTAAFVGWATAPAGQKVYDDQQPVSNLTKTDGATVDLYAVWNFETVTLPDPGIREGYSFAGWSDGSAVYAVGAAYTADKTVTLVAQWTPISYTISYDLAGGTVAAENPGSYTAETDSITLVNPTRPGYAFTGWTGTGLGNPAMTVVIEKGSIGARSYTATWEANTYRVTYSYNGGVGGDADKEVTYDSPYGELPDPARAGYSFVGWYTQASGGTEVTAETLYQTAGDSIIYAHWTANSYTVTLHYYDGVDTTDLPVTYDSPYGELPAPARTGYSFAGWYTQASGGTAVTAETVYRTDGNSALYAHWTAYTYTVKFDGNGATGGEMDQQQFIYDQQEELAANTFERKYTVIFDTGVAELTVNAQTATAVFNGWLAADDRKYTDAQPVSNLSSTDKGEVTLTAQWELESIELPDPGIRAGYEFAGWYEENVAQARSGKVYVGGIGAEYTPGENVTLYAEWTPITYTATFQVNGGSALTDTTVEFTIEDTLSLPATAKAGYTLKWKITAAEGSWAEGTEYSVQTFAQGQYGDVTFTAQWTVVTYTIQYHLNGGIVSQENQTTFTVESEQIKLHNPTKKGYTFTGWTGSNGTTPQTDVTIAAGSTENRTYTANFKPLKYTLTIYGKRGSNSSESYVVTYDGTDGNNLSALITNYNGFELKGLYTQKNGGGIRVYDGNGQSITGTEYWDASGKWVYDGDEELYGYWEEAEYTITCINTLTGEQTTAAYTIYANVFELADLSSPGYTFKGWRVTQTNGSWPNGSIVQGGFSSSGQYGDVVLETQWERALVDLTITTTCADSQQSFIFTVTGTPEDTGYGTITLDVVLVGTDKIVIHDLPVGEYTVTEKDGWSWRENMVEEQSADLIQESGSVDFDFQHVDEIYWLSSCSYYSSIGKRRKGGS